MTEQPFSSRGKNAAPSAKGHGVENETASPKNQSASATQKSKFFDKETVRKALNMRAPDLVLWLLPKAAIRGQRAYVGSVTGEKGKSLNIELAGSKVGLWHDHNGGQSGDFFDLYMVVKGVDFKTALADLAGWVGVEPSKDLSNRPAEYIYTDQHGVPVVTISRSYDKKGKKKFLPRLVSGEFKMPKLRRPLYNLPRVITGDTIIFVEREKCADALSSLGFVATTAMGGAKTILEKTDFEPLRGKPVVLWPDNDPAGFDLMHRATIYLAEFDCKVSLVSIPKGKPQKWDAADCVAEGNDAAALIGAASAAAIGLQAAGQGHSPGISGRALWYKEYPPLCWIVENILPAGLTLIYGPPKIGKSFLNLQLAVWIAQGRLAFGSNEVEAGDVCYWALEDSERRIQQRLKMLFPDAIEKGLKNLHFRTQSDTPLLLGHGAEEAIERWASECANPRLLLIDTLSRILPEKNRGEDDYTFYNRVLSPLRAIANEYGFSILLTHHTNKAKDHLDPFDSVLGSTGLNSVADASLVMRHGTSGNEAATLYGRGRDLDEFDLALEHDDNRMWSILGEADTVSMNKTRRAILQALKRAGASGISPSEVGKITDLKDNTVRKTLTRMAKAGQCRKIGSGLYAERNL